MSFFVLLCLSAFSLVSLFLSAVSRPLIPALDSWTQDWKSRDQVLLWASLLALPLLLGAGVVGLALFPQLGFGLDHCLVHDPHDPHHPHLCPTHASSLPGIVAIVAAVWVSLRLLWSFGTGTRRLMRATIALRELERGARSLGSVRTFASDVPEAYAVGILRPRLLVSTAVFGLDRASKGAVLEHERGHLRHGDLWLGFLARMVAFAHLPSTARELMTRLTRAQEVAADEFAANKIKDRLAVAETILALRQAQLRRPVWGLAFTASHVEYRVTRLLEERGRRVARAPRLVALAATTVVAAVLAHEQVHHGLESILGFVP